VAAARLGPQEAPREPRTNASESSTAVEEITTGARWPIYDHELQARPPSSRRTRQRRPLDDILVEAFARVPRGGHRALRMRSLRRAALGGMVLPRALIAEMRTGEGKTLVATSPPPGGFFSEARAKAGRPRRHRPRLPLTPLLDMGGASTAASGSRTASCRPISRRQREARPYRSASPTGQKNEFGFDYLRYNMKFTRAIRRKRS